MNERDESWMRRAIEVAGNSPEYPFGTVLVEAATGREVAVGWNRGREHPLWHGEIVAIETWLAQEFGAGANSISVDGGVSQTRAASESDVRDGCHRHTGSGLTLYTTAEPCCLCFGAIFWLEIPRIVFGTSIQSLVGWGWDQIQVPCGELAERTTRSRIEVVGGVLESECDRLFQR